MHLVTRAPIVLCVVGPQFTSRETLTTRLLSQARRYRLDEFDYPTP